MASREEPEEKYQSVKRRMREENYLRGMRTLSYHEAVDFECWDTWYDENEAMDPAGRMKGGVSLPTEQSDFGKKSWKYKNSAKTLIPIRSKPKKPSVNPLDDAGLFSFMTFSWLTPLIKMAYKGKLTQENFWQHSPLDTAEPNYKRFEKMWKEAVEKVGMKNASLPRTIWRFTRTRMLMSLLTITICMAGAFVGPAFVIGNLLEYTQSPDKNWPLGIGLVVAMFVTEMSRSVLFVTTWSIAYRSATRVLGAVLTLIFTKITRLRSLQDKTVGELVNLCANDGQRLFDATSLFILLFGAPFVFVLGLCYTVYLIGPASLLGCSMFILFYPFQAMISRLITHLRRTGIKITDRRVRTMNEILNSVKLIKMYAWEMPFAKAVSAVRNEERKVLEKAAYVQSFSIGTFPLVTIVASIVTITVHVMTGHDLTASQAFTMVAIYNSMRFAMASLPLSVKALAESRVGLQRMKSLLEMEEMKSFSTSPSNPGNSIEVKSATLAWDPVKNDQEIQGGIMDEADVNGKTEKTPLTTESAESEEAPVKTLFHIDLELPKGTLLGVCGSVGSGKSSLISGILGQMRLLEGTVGLSGSIAYVAQQAWIMNATVRDNILFGEDFDEQRYEDAVRACSLAHDFNILTAGDLTEIGERGINLSGGQKQRVSLARAVYSNRDIYLLDDPLSAVDAHVGQHIFHHCIKGALKDKTVLFVTHQLQYLHLCDQVILMKDGLIAEKGEHTQLMAAGQEYAQMIHGYLSERKDEDIGSDADSEISLEELLNPQNFQPRMPAYTDTRNTPNGVDVAHGSRSTSSNKKSDEEGLLGKLTENEKIETGDIGWNTYRQYLMSAGGYLVAFLVVFAYMLFIGSMTLNTLWLGVWISQGSGNTTILVGNTTMVSTSIRDNPNLSTYSLVYGMTFLIVAVMAVVKGLSMAKVTLRASSKLHDKVFKSIVRSPMSFFDTTPTGRILNRFSKDMDEVDAILPLHLEVLFMCFFTILSSIVVVSYTFPYFLIAIALVSCVFIYVYRIAGSCLREVKRLENVSRSPWLAHLITSVQGLPTLHAYNKTQSAINKFQTFVDKCSAISFFTLCSAMWLSIRLDGITIAMSVVTALLVVITHGRLPPAFAGLALSFVLQVTCSSKQLHIS